MLLFVRVVEKSLFHLLIANDYIALLIAITRLDAKEETPMNEHNICNYYSSLLFYKQLLSNGDISQEEYDKIETFFAKKYCIKIDSVIRSNELINTSFRVIYGSEKKEVISNEN